MDTIQEQIIEKIATIGVGESLLIFTTDQDTFIKFDAKLNGQIQMTADNGNIEVFMTRDNIAHVIEDFSIVEQIKELPLKTIKLNADGQFQVDDEPDTYLEADSDGIAVRSNVPLSEQIKAALLHILPILSEESIKDIKGDGSTLEFRLENGFVARINIDEKMNEVTISCSALAFEEELEAHEKDYKTKPLPFMVRVTYNEAVPIGYWVDFEVYLPARPFIAQHLSFALTKLADAMQDWTTNYGGNIV